VENPGITDHKEFFKLLNRYKKETEKIIYVITPSIINDRSAIKYYTHRDNVVFIDEIAFAEILVKIHHKEPLMSAKETVDIDIPAIRRLLKKASPGYYLPLVKQELLLDASGIPRIKEKIISHPEEIKECASEIGFPLAVKVIGPVHKAKIGGVSLNVRNITALQNEFEQLMVLKDSEAILIQPMVKGTELFLGAKKEAGFGHLIYFGLGGSYVEIIQDIQYALAPLSRQKCRDMITNLRGYPIIKGIKPGEGVNEENLIDIMMKLSSLIKVAPEIHEMDIDPLMNTKKGLKAIGIRILIGAKT